MNAPEAGANRATPESFKALAAASYVSLESYRKSGAPVRTPVWITADGGKLYCWTLTDTGKVRRIRANAEVQLAKCDASGTLEGEVGGGAGARAGVTGGPEWAVAAPARKIRLEVPRVQVDQPLAARRDNSHRV